MSDSFKALDEWSFRTRRLEGEVGTGNIVTSESTLILATPIAEYSQEALQEATAVGLAQNFNVNNQRQVIQFHEIGSVMRYTLSSGRTNGQLQISRVMFDGPSLLKVLSTDKVNTSDFERRDKPGYDNLFMNLQSSLFSKPVGLIMVMRDLENNNLGGVFFQESFISTHGVNISTQSPFIGENVSIVYNATLPLKTANA